MNKNRIFRSRLLLSCIFFVFSSAACAETPESIVAPSGGDSDSAASGKLEAVELLSLNYKGLDDDGDDCNVYVSALVEEEEDGHFHTEFFVKTDLVVHIPVPDSSPLPFRYIRRGERYFPVNSDQAGSRPVLMHIELKDHSEPDYSRIKEYLDAEAFELFKRFELNNQSFADFSTALLNAIEAGSMADAEFSRLDSASKLHTKVDHGDHSDPGSCEELVLQSELVTKTYRVGERHDHPH